MVLKDWEKEGKLFWENKVTNDQIWITGYGYFTAEKYAVVGAIGFPRRPKIIKSFKTKSQALKFAKSYMRNH